MPQGHIPLGAIHFRGPLSGALFTVCSIHRGFLPTPPLNPNWAWKRPRSVWSRSNSPSFFPSVNHCDERKWNGSVYSSAHSKSKRLSSRWDGHCSRREERNFYILRKGSFPAILIPQYSKSLLCWTQMIKLISQFSLLLTLAYYIWQNLISGTYCKDFAKICDRIAKPPRTVNIAYNDGHLEERPKAIRSRMAPPLPRPPWGPYTEYPECLFTSPEMMCCGSGNFTW